MKTIELTISNRYAVGGKVYLGDQQYAVNDGLAEILLSRRNERDMPYFRLVDSSPDEEEAAPKKPAKRAAAKKAAPKKKAARKKTAQPAGDEPSVSV